MVTRYFTRLRKRVGLDHLTFRTLRRFMDTYGQELGFSASQVAVRGGHDPSVALRYYIRVVADADRKVARAIASLITPPGPPPGSTATPTVTSDSQNGG
jgi:integrase